MLSVRSERVCVEGVLGDMMCMFAQKDTRINEISVSAVLFGLFV